MRHEPVQWRCSWKVEKFASDEDYAAGRAYEVIEREGNALMYGGASALWHRLTGGTTVAAFSNANAHIGVGDSTTAADPADTNLKAATNKLRKPMDTSYPTHSDGVTTANDDVVFRSVFGSSDANFAWQEWAVFNDPSAGRMLNRKVESLGTKASGSTWTLTVTLSLA